MDVWFEMAVFEEPFTQLLSFQGRQYKQELGECSFIDCIVMPWCGMEDGKP